MKNIRRMMLELCLVIGLVCGNALIVQAEETVPTKVIDGYVCEWQDLMDTTTILGYKGIESVVELAIPSELGGRKVDAIGYEAFKNCTSLETVVIQEGVTTICGSAFEGCSNLKSITMPKGMTRIDSNVFFGCSSLNEVSIPDGVTEIGSSTFVNCTNLQKVILPASLISIEYGAFTECEKLTDICLPASVTTVAEQAFWKCTSLKTLPGFEHVKDVGQSVFWGCSSLESVKLSNELTSIPAYMFSGCSSLECIMIPDSITDIEEAAFSLCNSLTDVKIPEGVANIGKRAFDGCPNLTNIELPKSLGSIGDEVFGYTWDHTVTIYVIPGSYADWWFTQDQPDYPNTRNIVYRLEDDNCCVRVLSKESDPRVEYRSPIRNDAVEYTIPDTVTINKVSYRVTSIADNAFTECSNVEKVTLGRNVTQIAPDAFAGIDGKDDKLELVIPEEVEDISNMGITNISNVNNITINVAAGSQAEIYLQQFNTIHCHTYPATSKPAPGQSNSQGTTDGKQDTTENVPSKPDDITVSNPTVDTQPVSAPVIGQIYTVGQANYLILSSDQVSFSGSANKKIKTLKIPDTVTINGHLYRVARIEKKAMTGCAKLQTVVIGNQVTAIGEKAFCKCKKLQKVTIGSQVTKIGKGAFRGDKKLKRMILKGSKVTKIGKKALKGVPKRIRITAPKKSVSKYKKLLNAAK